MPPKLFLLLVLLPLSCTRQELSGITELSASGPSKESWAVQIVISQAESDVDESSTRLMISADHMQWVGERDSTIQYLQGIQRKVEVAIYDTSGVFSAMIEADHVAYHQNQEYFIAEGGVSIRTNDNRTLVTEWIKWQERKQLLQTNEFVHITTPEEVVSGMGLEATEDLKSYQIGQFRAELILDQ